MSLPVALMLAATAGLASAETVPGTHWQLEQPLDWSEAERDLLLTLAASLPATYRMPQAPITLHRGPAPPLPNDLSTPHLVARPHRRGRVIEVGLDRLDAGLAEWETAQDAEHDPTLYERLVSRQMTHALTHFADAEAGWSRDPSWTERSEWGQQLWRQRAMETNRLSFASRHGMHSRQEDFATVAERVLLDAPLPGDPTLHPRCRLPSKWAHVAEKVGERPVSAAEACADLASRGLDPARVEAIELVFVQASVHSSSSIAGHSLVTVKFAGDRGETPTRWTFGLVADNTGSEEGTVEYVLRGLTGGFPSVVLHQPYARTSMHYSTLEDRDLTRFRLVLDEEQERAVLARLDELRFGWRRPYSLFTRNCTELPKDLFETATGKPVHLPDPYAPDALFAVLSKSGFLEKQPPESIQEVSLSSRVDAARRLQASAGHRVAEALPHRAAEVALALRRLKHGPTERMKAYAALAEMAVGLGPDHSAVLADLDRILAWSTPGELLSRQGHNDLMRTESSPEVDALWAAKAAVRAQARQQGVQIALLADSDAELFAEIERRPHTGTTQTPLRGMGVAPVLKRTGSASSVWFSAAGHLYRSRIGEARAFGMARGLELSLLQVELQLNTVAMEARTRQRILAARHLYGRAPVGNLGWYTSIGDFENILGRRLALDVGVAELGGAVELLQLRDHQHHLIAMAGGSVHAAVDPTDALRTAPGWSVGLPLGLSGRVSSGTHALTAVVAEASWQPRWGPADIPPALRTDASASVFLGELKGTAVALVSRWRGRQPEALWMPTGSEPPWIHEFSLGLWVEPY